MRHHHTNGRPFSPRVHQAAGAISSRLGIDEHDAIGRMLAQSAELDQALEYTALDVLDGVIRID